MTDREIAEALEIMTEAELVEERIRELIKSAAIKIAAINK